MNSSKNKKYRSLSVAIIVFMSFAVAMVVLQQRDTSQTEFMSDMNSEYQRKWSWFAPVIEATQKGVLSYRAREGRWPEALVDILGERTLPVRMRYPKEHILEISQEDITFVLVEIKSPSEALYELKYRGEVHAFTITVP